MGGAKFEDVTDRTNLGGKGLVGGPATALDFDRDGLLDLYIGYFGDYLHGEVPTLARRNSNALPDKLFRNKGNFVFEDVSKGSGVENTVGAVGRPSRLRGDGGEDLLAATTRHQSWYRIVRRHVPGRGASHRHRQAELTMNVASPTSSDGLPPSHSTSYDGQ